MNFKRFLALGLMTLIFAACVSAEQSAGIKPGNVFYSLDLWLDSVKINLAFEKNKNSRIIEVAEERAAEMEALLEKNDTVGLVRAQNELSKIVARVDENQNPGRIAALNMVLDKLQEKISSRLEQTDSLQLSSAKSAIETIQKKTKSHENEAPLQDDGLDSGSEQKTTVETQENDKATITENTARRDPAKTDSSQASYNKTDSSNKETATPADTTQKKVAANLEKYAPAQTEELLDQIDEHSAGVVERSPTIEANRRYSQNEFVRIQGNKFVLNGETVYSKGANWLGGRYIKTWPKDVNGTEIHANMIYLRDPYYNRTALNQELQELRETMGINTVRLPILADYDANGIITPASGERLREFTRLAYDNGIRIHWVFGFGHGQWKCPANNGTLIPCDPRGQSNIGNAVFYRPGSEEERITLNQVRTTAPYLKDEPGVLSYEFFNEVLLNGVVRAPGYQEQVLSFIRREINTLKAVNPNAIVASGEVAVIPYPGHDVWPWLEGKGVEYVKFEDIDKLNNGIPFSLYDIVDYVAPHLYLSSSNPSSNAKGPIDVILANSNKPVVLGEFGGGGVDQISYAPEELQAQVHQDILNEAKARLSGAWVWNPIPVVDLEPGKYRIDYWVDNAGRKRPIIVFFDSNNNIVRKFKTLSIGVWTYVYKENEISRLSPRKAARIFANRNAEFLEVTAPEQMLSGESYNVSFLIKNTGDITWDKTGIVDQNNQVIPYTFVLGAQSPHDNKIWGGRIALSKVPIKPGETTLVTAQVKAPSTPGTYVLQYRMLHTGVEWFGESSPAKQIQVNTELPEYNDAKFISQTVPTMMIPGGKYHVSLQYKNTGTKTWDKMGSPGDYTYAYRIKTLSPSDNNNFGTNFVPIPHEPIKPGEIATFSFEITAPSTQGYYEFQWRMNQGLVAWFGESSPAVKVYVSNTNRNTDPPTMSPSSDSATDKI